MTILNAMRNALNSDPSAVLVATSPEEAAKKCKTALATKGQTNTKVTALTRHPGS